MKTSKLPLSTSHCKENSLTSGHLARPLGAALLITLLAAASSGWAANILANPGFESGDPTGWVKYGVFDFNTTNNVYYNGCNCGSNVWIYDGRFSGKTYGQFTGGENYNGEYQDVGVAAGSVLSADCWVYTSTQDHIGGGNNAWIEVHFMDAGNNDLALFKSQVITTDPASLPLDAWLNYPVTNQVSPVVTNVSTLLAPPGTAKARYQIVFHQPAGYDGGSVYWDDARLNLISGPTPPNILNLYPSGTLLMQGTNKLAFTATSSSTITNVQVILNGTDVSGSLSIAGSATSNSVIYPSLQSNKLYSVTVTVKDANNLSSSVSRTFDTFDPNSFTWEAEDYDFNSGSYIDNPVLPSTSNPSPNSYWQKAGFEGVDYQDTSGDGSKTYRLPDRMATEVCSDLLRQKYVVAQQADPSIQDYDIGWFNPNEWINFTRTYPTGTFNIWARMSSPGASTLTLSRVTNGWGTASQSTVDLGTFSLLAGQGWGTYNWVPMTDPAGNLIQVNLGGTNTLRATTGGNNNAQFFMLVPANTNLPTITGIYPNGGLQSTNTFAFNANSAAGINANSIKVTLNGVDVSSALVIGGTPTARQVTYPFLAPNTSYNAIILVTDLNGQQANPTVNFDTFSGSAFVWEGVDYDYGGGQFFDEPSTNAYRGLAGLEGTDFHDDCNGGPALYRIDCPATEPCGDFARAKFVPGVATNYDLGFVNAGEWENYTRTYPSGTWNVYLRGARGTGGTVTMNFGRVTNGWGTASQELDSLGTFSLGNTGGWQSYRYVPLVDSNNRLADVPLAGTNTLRITGGGAVNYNFFILTPPLKLKANVSGGNFVLSFSTQPGFNYTVQSKTNLNDASWNSVSTVAGDGTTKSVNDPKTGPSRFYRLQVH
jgi:hypothetical protein